MKKIITLILILTTFMLVTLNTHASGATITLNPESGTIGTSEVTYDFDGTYMTINGSYSGFKKQDLFTGVTSYTSGDFYEIKVTYISGSYSYNTKSATLTYGNGEYYQTYTLPQYGESFTSVSTAQDNKVTANISLPSYVDGTFANYKIKIEVYNIPSVTEYKVHYMNGETLISTRDTVYQKAKNTEHSVPDGFVFYGWYDDESLTVEHDFNTTLTQDTILYAKIEPKKITTQDLTITSIVKDTYNGFHLRTEDSNAYLSNSKDLQSLALYDLSYTESNATILSFSSNKTYYDVMIIEYDKDIVNLTTLPAAPEELEISLWLDDLNKRVRLTIDGETKSYPDSRELKIYFANYNNILNSYNKVTYHFYGGTLEEYLKDGEKISYSNIYDNGYQINAWYLDPNFLTTYDKSDPVNNHLNLYGLWLDPDTNEPMEGQTPIDPEDPDDPTDPTNPIDPDNPNNPDNPLDPDEPNEDLTGILDFITDYWVALLFLVITIALLSNKKR